MNVLRARNSLRMSFWSVPVTSASVTPWRSAATRYIARMIGAVALIVKFTETWSSGRPENRSTMSSAVSIATPTRPTSGRAIACGRVVAELGGKVEGDR